MHALRRALPVLLLFLTLPFADAGAAVRDVVIYYTADTHGRIFSDADTIGIDRIAGIAGADPAGILLDAGDFLHGRPVAVMTQGRDVVRLMKKAGYLAATAGNHEFNYLPGTLERRAQEAAAPPNPMRILSANVFDADGSPLLSAEAETERNGIRVCVFGLTTPESSSQARASAVGGLRFRNALASGREVAAAERRRGCDLVVALTHLGSEPGTPGNSRELGARVPDIDVVIDGHSHVALEEALPRPDGRKAMLVSPGAHGEFLGRLTVSLDEDSGRVLDMRNHRITPEEARSMAKDEALSHELDALAAELDARLSVPVGTLGADFTAGDREARLRETALGDLCADVIRSAYGDDVALLNGGAIRGSLGKGVVNRGAVLQALPFNDLAVSLEVTGQELLDALEHGLARLPEQSGGFPQVSGFTVRANPAAAPGSRVVAVTMADGTPLDRNRTYTLGTNAFLADGGDGYPHFAAKRKRKAFKFMEEVFLLFIRDRDTSVYAGGPAGRVVLE